MHGAPTVYAPATRFVVVCMYRPRTSSSAMPPPSLEPTGTRSCSTSSNTTRRPCGGLWHCLHNICVLCMHIRRQSALCHMPHTCIAYAYHIYRTDFPGGVIWWHDYDVAKRRGQCCCMPSQSPVAHGTSRWSSVCRTAHTHIHTVALTRVYTCT